MIRNLKNKKINDRVDKENVGGLKNEWKNKNNSIRLKYWQAEIA